MRVLLVAATTGYQTRAFFGSRPQRIGFELVLATDRCHVLDDPWGDHAIALRFDAPEEGIESLVERGPFDGIAAVGDRPAYVAAIAAESWASRSVRLPPSWLLKISFLPGRNFVRRGCSLLAMNCSGIPTASRVIRAC